jgi:hypothetical protein
MAIIRGGSLSSFPIVGTEVGHVDVASAIPVSLKLSARCIRATRIMYCQASNHQLARYNYLQAFINL